jgi:hypothetical protein
MGGEEFTATGIVILVGFLVAFCFSCAEIFFSFPSIPGMAIYLARLDKFTFPPTLPSPLPSIPLPLLLYLFLQERNWLDVYNGWEKWHASTLPANVLQVSFFVSYRSLSIHPLRDTSLYNAPRSSSLLPLSSGYHSSHADSAPFVHSFHARASLRLPPTSFSL